MTLDLELVIPESIANLVPTDWVQVRPFEAQYATRTTSQAFTTRQAMVVHYGFAFPDVLANINTDRAVKCANTTLDTKFFLCDNLPNR